ncbi:cell division transport system permease protein [Kineococcus xinjiangensis]|uniref:Cell division protein FtsX n=1 Tax=Kineococcus xinjiangensis TaxID=512762 RepID=A0A2S6ICT3_9ACTN|nr:permease-like cell division protein FtsX [Kineococcus xinjiangensis]PPK92007.1 cell division transport system permease protein [Kineococcus xinjiangensis]
MRVGFVLSEMGIGLRRNLSMAISVILVTMVSLFFFGAALLVQSQVQTMKGFWYDKVQVSVYLCGELDDSPRCIDGAVTQSQRDAILETLETGPLDPYVDRVFYESSQQAYERFIEQFEDSAITENVTPDVLPESFRVKLADPTKYQVIAEQLANTAGVERVQDDHRILDPLFAALDAATYVALVLAGLMLLCAVLLVSTTIRLTAFSRRREIGIMRLVGASRWIIQLPFVLEGVLATLLGAALASTALWVIVDRGLGQLSSGRELQVRLIDTTDVLQQLPYLFGLGIAVAVLASLISLHRWLRI